MSNEVNKYEAERIKSIWLDRMANEPRTPAFDFACAVTCYKLSPVTKFTDMPDAIRFARIDDSVTPDELCAELLKMGFRERRAIELSREPLDFKIRDKRMTRRMRNEMIEKGLTYAWRKTKQAKTENT